MHTRERHLHRENAFQRTVPKIERNMAKDIETNHVLTSMGYTVIRVWEHDIRKDLKGTADMIERLINEKRSQPE